MTDQQRITKQIIIAVIFWVVVGGLGSLVYRGVSPTVITPTPNPTAHLIPIDIVTAQLIWIKDNDYDFVAKVHNVNTDYGSPAVVYEIQFYNATNSLVTTRAGTLYILPGQTKYLIETPLRFNEAIAQATLLIKSVDWQQLDPLAVSGINLLAKDWAFHPTGQPGATGQVDGALFNSSDYDISQADVLVLLFDQSGTVMAVNRTQIRTFLAHTTRAFSVAWFTALPGLPTRTEVQATTNVFENSNFLQRYQKPERFQEFY